MSIKKLVALLFMAVLVLTMNLSGFAEPMDDYTLLIYLNGTDLESSYDEFEKAFYGNASKDLMEMMAGDNKQGNINVIVQTGGTKKWANDYVSSKETQRFELENGKFKLVDSLPNQNMGYKKTLSDFIVWGTRNYPANKTGLVLWNHGAGPVGGYGYDELFEGDSLHLEELESALKTAEEKTKVTFEFIGFDACLMASIEVADTVKDYGKYLVASEELEPGHGWNYTEILKALGENPKMTGDALGKVIADTYYNHAVDNQSASDITLSVVDLAQVDGVVKAFEAFIKEADGSIDDDIFFYEFAKAALTAKSFGGNTEYQGYTDIIDLKDFVSYLKLNQEKTATALMNAIDKAVVYRIEGEYTLKTSGLSIYFPYRDQEYYDYNMEIYSKNSFSPVYKSFLKDFRGKLLKELGDGTIEYDLVGPTEDNSYYQLVLNDKDMNKVYYVYIDLYTKYDNPEEVGYVDRYLGYDFLVSYDEDTNSFFDDFQYLWTLFDTEPLMTFVVSDNDEFVMYESPVLYNEEMMNLIFAWVSDYETEEVTTTVEGVTTTEVANVGDPIGGHYEIYGLRRGIDEETGMPDKNLYQLEPGSILTPLYMATKADGTEEMIQGTPITVTKESDLYFDELSENTFYLDFRFIDFSYRTYQTDYFQVDK